MEPTRYGKMLVPQKNNSEKPAWIAQSQNQMLSLLMTLMILVPIFASPSNQEMQAFANKAILGIAALLTGCMVLYGRFRPSRFGSFVLTMPNAFVVLYLVSSVLSLALSAHDPVFRRYEAMVLQGQIAGTLLFFVMSYFINGTEQLLKVAETLFCVGGLISLLGISTQISEVHTGRIDFFGNSQLFGGFLMILLPPGVVLAFTETQLYRRTLAFVCTALMASGMFLSGTRSAWIGAFAMALSLIVFGLIGSSSKRRTQRAKLQLLIPGLTVLACVIFVGVQLDVVRIISERIESGTTSLGGRAEFRRAAIELYRKKPLVGLGPGSFAALQFQYTQEGRPYEIVVQRGPALSEMAHSFWWKTAAENGLFGLACAIGLFVSFLVAGMVRLRTLNTGVRRHLLQASLAGTVGFLADSFSNPCWEFPQISIFLWLTLGMGAACIGHAGEKSRRQSENKDW